MKAKKKIVLITGANGFIGKNIKEQLKHKHQMLSPSKKELDLLDQKQVDKYFEKNNIDVVVHCALIGGTTKEEQVSSTLSDNCRIFFNIVKNKHRFKKMIQLGSGAEYDKSRPLVKVKEEEFDKRVPKDYYGFAKYICSKYLKNEKDMICLRPFAIYGKYEEARRFISYSICNNLVKKPIIINKNIYYDYMYIDDFVKIVDYFIRNKAHHKFYNVGTGSKIDLITIANIINRIGKYRSKIIINQQGLNNEYSCDNTLLMKEIPNLRFTEVKDSIKKLYQWYRKQK